MESVSDRQQDYLEAVLALEGENDVARVTDLADRLGVSKPTVSAALKSLRESGLLEHRRYGHVRLTREGREIARAVARRHRLLVEFFRDVLGVEGEQAVEDACGVEHHISPSTRRRLTRFIDFIEACPRTGAEWLEHFRCFCRHDEPEASESLHCRVECLERCAEEITSSRPNAFRHLAAPCGTTEVGDEENV